MSVLNKMLRDLEQRQQSPGAAVGQQPASISRDDSRPLWLNMLLILSAVLLLFAVYAILNRPDIVPAQPMATAIIDAEPPPGEPESAAAHPAQLHTAATETMPTGTTPTDAAATETAATDTTPTDLALLSEPAAVEMPAEPPLAPAQPIKAVDTAAVTAVKVEVQRSVQSAAQKSAALQQQALQAAQSGQLMNSISLWQQVQALEPLQAAAYTAQARLWQQMGQGDRAQHILQQGLSNGVDSADIRLLLAQFYAQQQQWAAADAVLQPQFELAQYPEYYGLKATVAQQLGDSVTAQQWFARLIVLQPQQARWWLGTAIAFDQQGQRQQAQLHYHQALQWGDNLSADSRNYIQQRLAATE